MTQGPPFVSFEPRGAAFIPLLSIEGLLSTDVSPESHLERAAALYERCVAAMRAEVTAIRGFRSRGQLTPARAVWRLGDRIFDLVDNLEGLSLQIDDLYKHLVRDLSVNRKWLEKVIIFRRYIPSADLIPPTLNWGRCEKGTRRKAQRLSAGQPIS